METWDFWIDRGGTFTDVVARRPDGEPRRPQAAVGESRRLSRRRRARHPRSPRPRRRRADPAGTDRRHQDGHHGRHQRAAGAQGRAHAAGHHQGLPRRAADRLPGPAEDLRPQIIKPECCTSAWSRSTSACAPTAPSRRVPDSTAVRAELEARAGRRLRRGRDRVHARLSLSRA